MKRLLLPLLAALSLPTSVNAEVANYYLLGSADRHTFVVPMKTLEICEEAGQDFVNNKNWTPKYVAKYQITFNCVRAK